MRRRDFLRRLPLVPEAAALTMAGCNEGKSMAWITAAVGMPLDQVQQTADIDLQLGQLRDDSSVVIEQPVRLRYPIGTSVLELPETRMIWIGQAAGTVLDITLAPQREALPLREARELAIKLASQVEAAGWVRAPDSPALATEAEITRWVLSRPPHTLFKRTMAEWKAASTEVSMTLKELLVEGSATPARIEDVQFLVNLSFSDSQLRTKQRQRMYDKRQEIKGSDSEPVPLTFWLR